MDFGLISNLWVGCRRALAAEHRSRRVRGTGTLHLFNAITTIFSFSSGSSYFCHSLFILLLLLFFLLSFLLLLL